MSADRTTELMTLPTAAAALGIARSTAWVKALTGELQATRVGRGFIVSRDAVESYRLQHPTTGRGDPRAA